MRQVVGVEEEWWQPGKWWRQRADGAPLSSGERGTCLTLVTMHCYYHVVAPTGKIIKMAFNGRDCWYFLFTLFSVALSGSALYNWCSAFSTDQLRDSDLSLIGPCLATRLLIYFTFPVHLKNVALIIIVFGLFDSYKQTDKLFTIMQLTTLYFLYSTVIFGSPDHSYNLIVFILLLCAANHYNVSDNSRLC